MATERKPKPEYKSERIDEAILGAKTKMVVDKSTEVGTGRVFVGTRLFLTKDDYVGYSQEGLTMSIDRTLPIIASAYLTILGIQIPDELKVLADKARELSKIPR